MGSFTELLQQGTAHAWLFVPSAILLGTLHGLEPGHSKTMMAAFIIAVHGTVMQAALLGLAATVSHTAIVWGIALVGLHFGSQWNTETTEPYFQLVSAVIIIGIALWMFWRTWRLKQAHNHHHGEEFREIKTVKGLLTLEVFEENVPPRWRVRLKSGVQLAAHNVSIETVRANGERQVFTFVASGDYLQSVNEIPEPHAFTARVNVNHGGDIETYEMEFHEHDHEHAGSVEFKDAHERAHASDIQRRFGNRQITTGQIVMFGLSGGLIPCPASITILLLCLQLKQFTLGAMLVLCFSIGLAITMVTVGVAAALSVRHVSQRWSVFGELAQRAPYLSSLLIISVGLYTAYLGWAGLTVKS